MNQKLYVINVTWRTQFNSNSFTSIFGQFKITKKLVGNELET